MGGKSNRRGGNRMERKSSSSSFFSIFSVLFNKSSRPGRRTGDGEDTWDDARDLPRVRPSDEDKGRWVAEPGIDKKASEFIARFYETRVADSDHQTLAVEQQKAK